MLCHSCGSLPMELLWLMMWMTINQPRNLLHALLCLKMILMSCLHLVGRCLYLIWWHSRFAISIFLGWPCHLLQLVLFDWINRVTISQVMTTFMSPPPAATFLAFHPQDNNIIAIGMEDSSIQIYNVRVDEVKHLPLFSYLKPFVWHIAGCIVIV